MKRKTSLYLSDEATNLLRQLAEHSGISQSAALEQIIRQTARRELAEAGTAPRRQTASTQQPQDRYEPGDKL